MTRRVRMAWFVINAHGQPVLTTCADTPSYPKIQPICNPLWEFDL